MPKRIGIEMLTKNRQGLCCTAGVWAAMSAEMAVTWKGTRRFIERWVPFSISENAAVSCQSFAAMDLEVTQNAGGEQQAPVTPVAVRVAICALVWKKWINRPPGALFALFWAIWQKQPANPADRGCRAAKMEGKPGRKAKVEMCAG